MINPGSYDILCPQGATFDRTFSVAVDGVALNLTGYTAAMQVRQGADASSALISLTSGSGITLGGTAGTIRIDIDATTTGSVVQGSYSWDLELYQGATVTRLLAGAFNVTNGVTR